MTKKVKLAIICSAAAACVIAVVLTVTLVLCLRKGPDKYSVYFDTRGGSAIAPYSLEEGDTIARPTNPTKEMFIFGDWYTDTTYSTPFVFGSSMPAHDVTVYAAWIGEASVKITYNANGGEFADDRTEYSESGLVGAAYTAPSQTPERFGYVFDKWYLDEKCTVAFTSDVFPVDDLTLYAGWGADARYVYVSFYGNGKLLTVASVEKGKAVSDPQLFGDGVESDVWYKNPEMTETYVFGAADENISLYTSYYTDGLVIVNGTVTDYIGMYSEVIVPEKFDGATVTEIGANAFYVSSEYCRITRVTLPDTITTIADRAFYDCRYLESVNLTDKVTTIGADAFYGNNRLRSFGDISSVTSIGDGAFAGCYLIREIQLPVSLRSLGNYAFSDCTSLTEISVPSGVSSIGEYTFNGCSALKNAEINATGLQVIGMRAFYGCKSLEQIVIKSFSPPNLQTYSSNGGRRYSPFFGASDDLSISVPSSALAAYLNSYGDLDDGSLGKKFTTITTVR